MTQRDYTTHEGKRCNELTRRNGSTRRTESTRCTRAHDKMQKESTRRTRARDTPRAHDARAHGISSIGASAYHDVCSIVRAADGARASESFDRQSSRRKQARTTHRGYRCTVVRQSEYKKTRARRIAATHTHIEASAINPSQVH